MFSPERILVPTDFSECGGNCSMLAVKQAVGLAKQYKSKLVFMHVITEDLYSKPFFFLDEEKINILKVKVREDAEEQMGKIIDEYAADIKNQCSVIIREGKPYTEILNEEKESGVDLIVISTRGISGLQGVFYGSVTEKVVRHATCSVLVVRKVINRES
ncbi:MAG: universal stress protein [Ignavibacteriae bacterium]|nr:universal stress protein [Ignavibacteriota bacterium]MCB0750696.1 universal stress protein [Ignavibacteriota bacterium]